MPEQRKTPGLSSGEVQAACRALSSLHDAFQIEDDEDGKRTYLDAMWGIVDMMKIRLGIPEIGSPVNDSRPPHRYFQSVSSPRITEDDLPRPKITWTGHLELKQSDALEPRAEKAEAVGKSGARSSANLHSHLEYLRTLTRDPVSRLYRFQDTDLMLGIVSGYSGNPPLGRGFLLSCGRDAAVGWIGGPQHRTTGSTFPYRFPNFHNISWYYRPHSNNSRWIRRRQVLSSDGFLPG